MSNDDRIERARKAYERAVFRDRRADAFATLDEARDIASAHGAHAIVRHIEQARAQI